MRKIDSMGSRVDMAGRRLSESTVESSPLISSSHSRTQSRRRRSHNNSERSSRSKMSTVESSISLGSIDMDSTSVASSLDDDEAFLDPLPDVDTSKALDMKRKSVRFSSVHLRDYEICIGDNPSVSRGAPIALDWHFQRELEFSLEAFENSEHSAGTNKANPSQPSKHSSLDRMHVLKKMGYSRADINEATEKAQKIKQQRIQTRRAVERRDKMKKYLKVVTRFFQSPKKSLDASSTTVSTRGSSVDWTTIRIEENADKSQQSGTKKRLSGRTIQWAKKQDWKDDLFRQLQQQKEQSKSESFLDQARHPKRISTLDLSAYSFEAQWSMNWLIRWSEEATRCLQVWVDALSLALATGTTYHSQLSRLIQIVLLQERKLMNKQPRKLVRGLSQCILRPSRASKYWYYRLLL